MEAADSHGGERDEWERGGREEEDERSAVNPWLTGGGKGGGRGMKERKKEAGEAVNPRLTTK